MPICAPIYIDFAEARARNEALGNIAFQVADVSQLPWPEGYFDLIWSKYLLQWQDRPETAIREFRRVLKPCGILVCCNFDGFAVTHYPIDPALQDRVNRVFSGLVDPFIGRKMAPMLIATEFSAVAVEVEPDQLFTVIGTIDPQRRRNWEEQLAAVEPYIAKILGGEGAATEFVRDFLAFQDDPETCSYTTLLFARGMRPR